MNNPEIRNAEQYVANYPALARLLGSDRTQPHEGELALVAEAAGGRRYHAGSMGTEDMFFMTALIRILQPRQALEIGTASGASAAMMVRAIAQGYAERGEALPATLLHTIDRKDRCLFDETQPIGFQVAELTPELADRVAIHTLGDSSLAASFFDPQGLSFAFVDGNHQHPWPLIDLLHLLPLMHPGGWIVLDDINLPDFYPGPAARYGPRYLFEAWPAARLSGLNVGAVQVPADPESLRPMVELLLEKPFEVSQSGWKRYRKQLDALKAKLWPELEPADAGP